jgi:lipopolysaccharide export system protein LptA
MSQYRRKSRGLLVALAIVGVIAAAAAATPSAAQLQNISAQHDSDQPIEITADTLEVRQSDNLAIFRGDVDALQGDMHLTADVIVVHYRENKETPDQPGISRIDAEGNVFVSSPEETAQGQRGVYDVDGGRIDLVGEVVLTQGENVVRGERLELDLETGLSRVVSGADGSGGKQRVRGLFVPQKKKN